MSIPQMLLNWSILNNEDPLNNPSPSQISAEDSEFLQKAMNDLVVDEGARLRYPINKSRSAAVTCLNNLRPVSYVDDLEMIFDRVWLTAVSDQLKDFAGEEQGGGVIVAGPL